MSSPTMMPLPDDCAVPDPLDLLAFVACGTESLGLATGVLILPAHNPVVLAKRLATIDRLSKVMNGDPRAKLFGQSGAGTAKAKGGKD